MIHFKCALCFCGEFPEYNLPDEEIYDGPNGSLVHFIFYTYQGICETHVIIKNGPCLYRICEGNYDINNGLIKIPTYRKKKNVIKMSCFIGEFYKVHYQPMLNKYSYSIMLLCLLGKHE